MVAVGTTPPPCLTVCLEHDEAEFDSPFDADTAAVRFLSGAVPYADLHRILATMTEQAHRLFIARVQTNLFESGRSLTDEQIRFVTRYAAYGDREADTDPGQY